MKNFTITSHVSYEFCARAYGVSLVSLFLVSSIYHWICWTQNAWKKVKYYLFINSCLLNDLPLDLIFFSKFMVFRIFMLAVQFVDRPLTNCFMYVIVQLYSFTLLPRIARGSSFVK